MEQHTTQRQPQFTDRENAIIAELISHFTERENALISQLEQIYDTKLAQKIREIERNLEIWKFETLAVFTTFTVSNSLNNARTPPPPPPPPAYTAGSNSTTTAEEAQRPRSVSTIMRNLQPRIKDGSWDATKLIHGRYNGHEVVEVLRRLDNQPGLRGAIFRDLSAQDVTDIAFLLANAGARDDDPTMMFEYLGLAKNRIQSPECESLAASLAGSRTLKIVDLYDNNIGKEGAKAVAEALKRNTSIKFLSIGKNFIGDDGAMHLAEMMKANTTLDYLAAWNNEITDVGAAYMASAIRENTPLLILNISYNQITTNGARRMLDAVSKNTNMKWLWLDLNKIDDDVIPPAKDCLNENKTLDQLHLETNPFKMTEKQLEELEKQIPRLRLIAKHNK